MDASFDETSTQHNKAQASVKSEVCDATNNHPTSCDEAGALADAFTKLCKSEDVEKKNGGDQDDPKMVHVLKAEKWAPTPHDSVLRARMVEQLEHMKKQEFVMFSQDTLKFAEWLAGERADNADSIFMTDESMEAKAEVLFALCSVGVHHRPHTASSGNRGAAAPATIVYSPASMCSKSCYRTDPSPAWSSVVVALSDAEFNATELAPCVLYDPQLEQAVAYKNGQGEYEGFTQVKLFLSSANPRGVELSCERPTNTALVLVDTSNRLMLDHWFSCGPTTPDKMCVTEIPHAWHDSAEATHRWCELVCPAHADNSLLVCTRDQVPRMVQVCNTDPSLKVHLIKAVVASIGHGMNVAQTTLEFAQETAQRVAQVANQLCVTAERSGSVLTSKEDKQLRKLSEQVVVLNETLNSLRNTAEKLLCVRKRVARHGSGLAPLLRAQQQTLWRAPVYGTDPMTGEIATVSEAMNVSQTEVQWTPRAEILPERAEDGIAAVISMMDSGHPNPWPEMLADAPEACIQEDALDAGIPSSPSSTEYPDGKQNKKKRPRRSPTKPTKRASSRRSPAGTDALGDLKNITPREEKALEGYVRRWKKPKRKYEDIIDETVLVECKSRMECAEEKNKRGRPSKTALVELMRRHGPTDIKPEVCS